MAIRSARELVEAAMAEVRTLSVAEARAALGRPGVLFVDLREGVELEREGRIPGALHVPRGLVEFAFDPTSEWQRPALTAPGVQAVLFCALGWRSALAAQTLQRMGVPGVAHLGGGFGAWRAEGGPVEPAPATTGGPDAPDARDARHTPDARDTRDARDT